MRTKRLLLSLAAVLSGCALFPKAAPPEDMSIRFPEFRERAAMFLSEERQPYELDGALLRALSIAANDFNPPKDRNQECWEKPEAHRYRVIRQADVVFVQISLDPKACGTGTLDGGVKYAIRSSDGRILRRLFDGEPEIFDAPPGPSVTDTTVPASEVGSTSAPIASDLPSSWFKDGGVDAGSASSTDGGQEIDGGLVVPSATPSAPDAGR
ncbi:hypothetical protein [Melittangium boletus]|uniref:hypothetical protein n=1 Tax=Melittangium boletus TaxID=83453 RepID=UPI003DA66715